MLEKKWEYSNEVCQLFVNFGNVYDYINRESLCDILILFDISKEGCMDLLKYITNYLKLKFLERNQEDKCVWTEY
jgi:hypothetical protein